MPKPFANALVDINMTMLADAKRNFDGGQPDFVWPALGSLGITEDENESYRGCAGCYVHPYVVEWYMEGIQRIIKPRKVSYVGNRLNVLFVSRSHKLADVAFAWKEEDEVTLKQVDRLFDDQELKYVVLLCNWMYLDLDNPERAMPGHATSLVFHRNTKRRVIECVLYDSFGADMQTHRSTDFIIDSMRSISAKTYVPRYPNREIGPQSQQAESGENEPHGYCEAWSAVFLIVTMLLDGKPSNERIADDLPQDDQGLLWWIKYISIGLVRTAIEKGALNPELKDEIYCCDTRV